MSKLPGSWLVIGGGVVLVLLMTKKTTGQSSDNNSGPFTSSGARGIRNNNPGNIRISGDAWQGKVSPNTDGAFEQFTEMKWGARAMLKILRKYIISYGLNTIPALINRWAPASDGNNPTSYAAKVCTEAQIGKDTIISENDGTRLSAIAAAMSQIENGRDAAIKAGLSYTFFADAWKLI